MKFSLFTFVSSCFFVHFCSLIPSRLVLCSSFSASVSSIIYLCPFVLSHLPPSLLQAFVENNPAIRWCPAARCERAVRLTRPGPGDSDPQSFPLLPSPAVDCGKGHLFCWYTSRFIGCIHTYNSSCLYRNTNTCFTHIKTHIDLKMYVRQLSFFLFFVRP